MSLSMQTTGFGGTLLRVTRPTGERLHWHTENPGVKFNASIQLILIDFWLISIDFMLRFTCFFVTVTLQLALHWRDAFASAISQANRTLQPDREFGVPLVEVRVENVWLGVVWLVFVRVLRLFGMVFRVFCWSVPSPVAFADWTSLAAEEPRAPAVSRPLAGVAGRKRAPLRGTAASFRRSGHRVRARAICKCV